MADEPEEEPAPEEPDATPAAPLDYIAENLRALFRNAAREPLPEALQELLDRLAREDSQ